MLSTLFQEWLQNFDRQMAQKYGGECVLLLLNNCPNHKLEGLNLQHVEICFLSLNTTSKI